jgi:NADH-quinone oxidoreductase subunit M
MGPLDGAYSKLGDALWNEKLAAGLLITGIVLIGVAPFLINQLIGPGTAAMMEQIGKTINLK